ncbi:MAG: EAL domain-containing protein [Candidimonas sp.]|nr:MAG: EAL domain-containing protein [Candidimonas sp.]
MTDGLDASEEIAHLRRRLAEERAARQRAQADVERIRHESDEHRRTIELLEANIAVASRVSNLGEMFEQALRNICAYLGWPLGHIFLADAEAPSTASARLESSDIWYCAEPGGYAAFREATVRDVGVRGMPGRVLAIGQPLWIADIAQDSDFPRASAARVAGLRTACAFPIVAHAKIAAVLEFFTGQRIEPDAASMRVLDRVSTQLGLAVERQHANDRLIYEAFHDPLTALPNRVKLLDRLQLVLDHSKRRPDYRFAVLFLDLDRFKSVNDSLGHACGDALIAEAGHRLAICLRRDDLLARGAPVVAESTVARLGGDEFTIILEGIRYASDAMRVAERIQWALAEPFTLADQKVYVSASIGIALSTTGYDTAQDILRDADIAMYRAKANGRARYELFDQAMGARAKAALQLEAELHRAVTNQEFFLVYQPIVSLGDAMIRGFEALLRWRHPQRGMLSPAEFLPLAEETGLIRTIGRWVLEEAAHQTCRWQYGFPADPPLTMSVNVSASQLAEADFVDAVRGILSAGSLPAHSFKLELTESVAMIDAERTRQTLLELKAMGVHLSLDDFGTGYSSLSYLRRLPVDTLKIDRSFVTGINLNKESQCILETITMLAHALGMEVVAEGAETAEELTHLRRLKCDYVQGYYFSGPLDRLAATAVLRNQAKGKIVLTGAGLSHR